MQVPLTLLIASRVGTVPCVVVVCAMQVPMQCSVADAQILPPFLTSCAVLC